MIANLFRGDVMANDFAIHVLFANATRNQLGELRAKIQYENSLGTGDCLNIGLLLGGNCHWIVGLLETK